MHNYTNNLYLSVKKFTIPKKCSLLFLVLMSLPLLSHAQSIVENPDPHRFEKQIKIFNRWDSKNSFPQQAILFIGSSSIRHWKTHKAFPHVSVINRGFGGAQISDILYYYNVVIAPYHPTVIVFYCGDNDIAAGKPVMQVFRDYKRLVSKILQGNPDVLFIYLPIKPSPSRWKKWWQKMHAFNQKIKVYNSQHKQLYYVDLVQPLLHSNGGTPKVSLFRKDHLHLNKKGYKLWDNLLEPKLKDLYIRAIRSQDE